MRDWRHVDVNRSTSRWAYPSDKENYHNGRGIDSCKRIC